MSVVPVDERGTVLSYTDSGPVAGDSYTTFVVIHGGNWFNGVFRRLMSLAPQCSMRLICLNRRDFPGSTPYCSDEVDPIKFEDGVTDIRTHEDFMIARGHEIAQFICEIVKKEKIPKVSRYKFGTAGGVVLLGWSLGNAFGFAAIANMQTLPPESVKILDEYLHTYVAFDAPHFILGPEEPPEADTSKHLKALLSQAEPDPLYEWGKWLSSYFRHDFDAVDGPKLEFLNPDPDFTPSIERFSREELKSCCAYDNPPKSEVYIRRGGPMGVFGRATRRVLFSKGLRVKVKWVWCDMSLWDTVWVALRVQQELAEFRSRYSGDPADLVDVEVKRVEGANHFVHWDNPTQMMDVLEECISR